MLNIYRYFVPTQACVRCLGYKKPVIPQSMFICKVCAYLSTKLLSFYILSAVCLGFVWCMNARAFEEIWKCKSVFEKIFQWQSQCVDKLWQQTIFLVAIFLFQLQCFAQTSKFRRSPFYITILYKRLWGISEILVYVHEYSSLTWYCVCSLAPAHHDLHPIVSRQHAAETCMHMRMYEMWP